MPPLLRTPFHEFHIKAGAKMVEFAGWEMPLLYNRPASPDGESPASGIIAEHLHTRSAASLFDVSHMGRLKFTGKDAENFLQQICTRNLGQGVCGQSMYSLVCNARGGILDDVIVSRFEKHWYMVCNASNREKLLAWFPQHCAGLDLSIEDETLKTAMVAIQGPKAVAILDSVLPDPVSELRRYHFEVQRYMMMIQFTVFRSGYTGEDGAEIICGTTAASLAVNFLLKGSGQHETLQPAGLGARDTLRLEAGMPLYGHELGETLDPFSANLAWAVDLNKNFIGADALRKIKEAGPSQKLVGLLIDGPRCARQGMTLLHNGAPVGTITSGAMSPTLKRPIAMAYVNSNLAATTDPLTIAAGKNQLSATLTPLPFYKRPK